MVWQKIRKLMQTENGNAIALSSFSMFVFLSVAGMAIDVGSILTSKTQLQCAVDAATLAGAKGLIEDQQNAVQEAQRVARRNRYLNQILILDPTEITFPNANNISVQVSRSINLFFLQLIGINNVTISVSASAMIGSVNGAKGLKPWVVPDEGWNYGDPVILKEGSNGITEEGGTPPPSWHFPVCFPPLNVGSPQTGADIYRENIVNGSNMTIELGDVLTVEPGNMVGPTLQGVKDIFDLDPCAEWSANGVINSWYAGHSSPRICKIALIDPNQLPVDGRTEVTVTRFGVFFIEGMRGQDLIGRYMHAASIGEVDDNGGSNSDIYAVKLTG